jgi:hypothetical protein
MGLGGFDPCVPGRVIHTPRLVERHHDGCSGVGDGNASQGKDKSFFASLQWIVICSLGATEPAMSLVKENQNCVLVQMQAFGGVVVILPPGAEDPVRRIRPRRCAESKEKESSGPEGGCADGGLAR